MGRASDAVTGKTAAKARVDAVADGLNEPEHQGQGGTAGGRAVTGKAEKGRPAADRTIADRAVPGRMISGRMIPGRTGADLAGPDPRAADRAAMQAAGAERRARRWNAARERLFIETLTRTANVAQAAAAAGMTRRAAYARKQTNAMFANAWKRALDVGYAELEQMLLAQALGGTERREEVRDADGTLKQVKTVHSFPHAMAMRLLLLHRAEVASYRAMTASGEGEDVAMMLRARIGEIRTRMIADGRLILPGAGTSAGALDMSRTSDALDVEDASDAAAP